MKRTLFGVAIAFAAVASFALYRDSPPAALFAALICVIVALDAAVTGLAEALDSIFVEIEEAQDVEEPEDDDAG
jgi:hypothetical protein